MGLKLRSHSGRYVSSGSSHSLDLLLVDFVSKTFANLTIVSPGPHASPNPHPDPKPQPEPSARILTFTPHRTPNPHSSRFPDLLLLDIVSKACAVTIIGLREVRTVIQTLKHPTSVSSPPHLSLVTIAKVSLQ